MLRRPCAWEWRVIGSWFLELVSVVAWGELRWLADTSGAFVRVRLIPCGVILPRALLRVPVSVAATSRLAGEGVKRASFGGISMCLFLDNGEYVGFSRGSF